MGDGEPTAAATLPRERLVSYDPRLPVHRHEGLDHDCFASGCDLLTLDHECPVCRHACAQLERDLAGFMQTGTFHPDAVRGTSIDPQIPDATLRSIESTGMVVGVKGDSPEPSKLAAELRELARLVEHEGWIRHQEKMRRLGLAVARTMGPRWSQRQRMITDKETR